KKAVTDGFECLENYKFNIALVAPAFYGQFSKTEDVDLILTALTIIGFDDVFEVAQGAQAISAKTQELLESGQLLKPAISSACPAVSRLIAVRFPDLIKNIIPLRSPMEISAEHARRVAIKHTNFKSEEIGIFFISPCAAKATAVKDGLSVNKSEVDGVISIKDTYLKLAQQLGNIENVKKLTHSGKAGILWATSGGESRATHAERTVSVDGIHNVINVLDDIEDDRLGDIDYVEALACPGGCVGGPLTTENNFVARSRIKRICKHLPQRIHKIDDDIERMWDKPPVYRPVMKLDNNIKTAMQMAIELDEIRDRLPGLDCGSCGSPCCHSLAEDIVRGYAKETDCIFLLKEKLNSLIQQMTDKKEEND
ncbi:MAG: [Fe-Fe] hydrogenase large subunit C-terminal domain-containing protein, partial [Oscillospiraceae bacterium]